MTDKDFWKAILDGDAVKDPTMERPVSIRDVELVARFLYDRATLEFPMNGAPATVAAAAESAVKACNAAMSTLAVFAEAVRQAIEERDGPFPEPEPDYEEQERDIAARSSHRPASRDE